MLAADRTGVGRCPSLDARRRHGPAASAGRRVGSAADDTQGVTQSVAQSAAQGVDLQARLLLLLILAARWQQRQRRSWLCELLRQAVLVRHQQRRAGRVGRWASQTLAGRRSFSSHGRGSGSGVFVDVFHVFHECFIAEE